MEATKPSSAGAPGRPPSKSGRRTKDVGGGITKVEEKMLDVYGGRQDKNLPTTMMFDHVSPATRLLEKRRQMFEVQEALNSQKDEFSRREDAFRRREDGLRRKDLELQESLIKFNKFLKENESKRNRALKRAAEERKQREAKEMEIKKLEQQLKEKLLEENELKEEVQRNLQYQDFLESVCQNMSKYFPEISDILNRYKHNKSTQTHTRKYSHTHTNQHINAYTHIHTQIQNASRRQCLFAREATSGRGSQRERAGPLHQVQERQGKRRVERK